jgi:hypothetical protein
MIQELQGSLNFSGETYEPNLDKHRLSSQFRRVWNLMVDGKWRSLPEIRNALIGRDSEAAISARLRDFRKPPTNASVDRRRRENANGLFEYRVTKCQ